MKTTTLTKKQKTELTAAIMAKLTQFNEDGAQHISFECLLDCQDPSNPEIEVTLGDALHMLHHWKTRS